MKRDRIPTMQDVERHGYAVFPDYLVDALLGPMPPGMKREESRPYHPEEWPPDKPGLEYIHRALARRLIGIMKGEHGLS